MSVIQEAILLLSLASSNAATLLTIPVQQPLQETNLSPPYNIAFNFEADGRAVIVSSVDVAFGNLPANLKATFYPTSVFDPLNPAPNGSLATALTPSAIFPGGVSFDFPDTMVQGSSFFAVLLTFSPTYSVPFGTYFEGDVAAISTEGPSFHSVIVSDLLGNPDTLYGSPAISVQGAIVPEPGVLPSVLLAFGIAGCQRRRKWIENPHGGKPHAIPSFDRVACGRNNIGHAVSDTELDTPQELG